MLLEMRLENFGLMEKIELTFGKGLTLFSGETGAGKSMLIDALGVLLGGRGSADLIRHGEEQARLEGVFAELSAEVRDYLESEGYPAEDGQLFLFRELNISGRNICRIQGRSVPLSLYKTLCHNLVDIHGQMEQQSLLRADNHLKLLDAFGGPKQQELLDKVRALARSYKELVHQEQELKFSEQERERREDLLRYQIGEIDQVAPVPGEEEILEQEKKRLSNAERIMNLVGQSHVLLYRGAQGTPAAYDILGQAHKCMQELVRLDESCSGLLEALENVYYTVEDLAAQIRAYQLSFEFEPGRLDELEDRLNQLHRLRKYGNQAEEVLKTRSELAQELDQITHMQEKLEEIALKKAGQLKEYGHWAQKLSAARKEQALLLERGLESELKDLALEQSKVEVRFSERTEPGLNGSEDAEFFFSANPGEPLKPLAKVASGGEISRLMLAFKSMLAQVETVGTFIFDEVDSGIGGRTLIKVGEKLSKIACYKQVFCITHAAQVAAFAEEHYGIYKDISDGRTRTHVKKLTVEERVRELARMLGGEQEEITRQHALELLQHFGSNSNYSF